MLLDEISPLEHRRNARVKARIEAAKAVTFKECAESYMAAKSVEWRHPIHVAQWAQSLRDYVYPIIGDLPVATIDTALVLRVLEPIWKTMPETASRVRGRIEMALDAATVRGYRQGPNPAQWKGNLAHILPARTKVKQVEHFAALPIDDVSLLMAALRQQEGIAARALEFLILTTARTGEVVGAQWTEIDGEVWRIPGNRMKRGRPHVVPLSDAAMRVLKRVKSAHNRADGLIFPRNTAGERLLPAAMRRALSDAGFAEKTSVHGLRSSFSSWAASRTNAAHETIEMQLAHAVGDAVVRAYQRDDLKEKRRVLVEQWAQFCSASPAARGKVVAIGGAR